MTFPHPHSLRTVSMPLGMVVGAMFCRPIAALETASGGMITPSLIFLMLFFTFCRVDVRSMRLQPLHLWLLTAQIVFSVAVYGILLPFSPTVAQGGMICVLTPIAMAAVVIGGMLGADIVSMTTFSLLCNMTIAVVAPFILSVVGSGDCSLAVILARVAPLLILPFAAAQGCRALIPKVSGWVAAHSQISFYLWLVSLTVIIGRTTTFILDHPEADGAVETALAATALVICLVQFRFGRWLGRRYGDAVAGGQTGLLGGGALQHGEDLHSVVYSGLDGDPDAHHRLAVHLVQEGLVLLGGHVGGIGVVQGVQNGLNRVLVQDIFRDLVHIIGLEQRLQVVRLQGGGGQHAQAQGQAEGEKGGKNTVPHDSSPSKKRKGPDAAEAASGPTVGHSFGVR